MPQPFVDMTQCCSWCHPALWWRRSQGQRPQQLADSQQAVPLLVVGQSEAAKTASTPSSKLTVADKRAEEKLRKKLENASKRRRARSGAAAQLTMLRAKLAKASQDSRIQLVAVDVEAWEEDSEKVTEIGLAAVQLPAILEKAHASDAEREATSVCFADASCFRHRHILIREHLELRNGRFVQDNKDKFLFGDSEVFHSADVARELMMELSAADFIIGHAARGDLAWLQKLGVNCCKPQVVDIQTLALCGTGLEDDELLQIGLGKLAEKYELHPQHMHNAANDASFTLQVMLSQCDVAFERPRRSISAHASSAIYQVALAEAEVRGQLFAEGRRLREEELQAEVLAFDKHLKAHANTLSKSAADLEWESEYRGGDQDASVSAVAGNLETERRFPHTLTGQERKIVHKMAEALGLHSKSRNEGPNGEPCVCISAGGLRTASAKSERQGRRRYRRAAPDCPR